MTLVFTALMAAVWLLGERATGLRCIAVAIILGVAITTKFSGSLAIPILALALLARVASSHPWPVLRWTAVTRIQRLFAGASIGLFSFLVAWMIIWATYDFRFSPGPSPDTVTDLSDVMNACAACESIASHHNTNWDLTTAQVAQWAQDWQPGPIERTSLWINDHRLLPQSFIHGFLMTYATTLYRGSFFCGELSYFGRWYYFPAAMAFKTPLATLVALPLALFACLAEHKNIVHKVRDILASKKFWPFCAAAILPAYYMASAIHAQVNLGLRHIFPVYPFLFIFLGVAAAIAYAQQPRIATVFIGVFVIGLVAETFCADPDYLSFFNVAAGGQLGGAETPRRFQYRLGPGP